MENPLGAMNGSNASSASSSRVLDLSAQETTFYLAWLCAIFIVGVPINLFLIYVVWYTKKLHSVHNYLVVNLCLCNAFTCVVPASFTFVGLVYHLTQHTYVISLCYLRHVTVFLGLVPNFLTLILLSIEKHDSIVRPLSKRLSKDHLPWVLVALWALTVLGAGAVSLEYWSKADKKCFLKVGGSSAHLYYTLSMGTFFIMLFVTSYCYIRIVCSLRDHQQKGFNRSTRRKQRLEKRPLQMIAVMAVTFIVCWMPTGIVRFVRSGRGGGAAGRWYIATGILVYITAICHPATCFAMSSQLRRAARRILCSSRTSLSRDATTSEDFSYATHDSVRNDKAISLNAQTNLGVDKEQTKL